MSALVQVLDATCQSPRGNRNSRFSGCIVGAFLVEATKNGRDRWSYDFQCWEPCRVLSHIDQRRFAYRKNKRHIPTPGRKLFECKSEFFFIVFEFRMEPRLGAIAGVLRDDVVFVLTANDTKAAPTQ